MFNLFRRKDKREDTIKKTYIELLTKYTSITTGYECVDKDVKKCLSGKFAGEFDSSMFLVRKNTYAIRFKDDMPSNEFLQVFELLKKDLGDPDEFSEYDGYIWKRRECAITFGLVSLNHNYEVPMICVSKRIISFFSTVSYEKYISIAKAMSKPLLERGINPQENHYYDIAYFADSGHLVIAHVNMSMLFVSYKNNSLEVSVVPLRREGEFTAIESRKQYRKQISVDDISDLEDKLDVLLEETKKYHGLNKIK